MAVVQAITLTCMAREGRPRTKRIPPEMFERVSKLVDELVRTRFDNNQTYAARELECSPGTVSAMINKTRGPGLNTLLALRDITGRSIDDILGLEPTPADKAIRELRESVEAHLFTQLAVKEAVLKGHEQQDAEALKRREAQKAEEKKR